MRKVTHLSEAYYVVQSIIGKRQIEGTLQYKVRWEGYSDNDSTWEPLQNLTQVMDLVKAFDRSEKDKLDFSKNSVSKNNYPFIIQTEKQIKTAPRRLESEKDQNLTVEPPKRKLKMKDGDNSLTGSVLQNKQKKIDEKKTLKSLEEKSDQIKLGLNNNNYKKLDIKQKKSQIQSQKQAFPTIVVQSESQSKSCEKQDIGDKTLDKHSKKIVKQGKQTLKKGTISGSKTSQSIGPKVRRINHIILQNQKILYEVEYELGTKNRHHLQLISYEDMTQQCKLLVPKYYEKVLILLGTGTENEKQQTPTFERQASDEKAGQVE